MLSSLFIAALWLPALERAGLLSLVGDVYCIFVTFPCGILGQMWYLIVLFPDLCRLSYFDQDLIGVNTIELYRSNDHSMHTNVFQGCYKVYNHRKYIIMK